MLKIAHVITHLVLILITASVVTAQDPNRIIDTSGQTRFFYIIVGDNRDSEGNTDLHFAEQNAKDLFEALSKYNTHGDTEKYRLLGSEGYTICDIHDLFEAIKLSAQSGDEVVFYYSGHGLQSRQSVANSAEADDYTGSICHGASCSKPGYPDDYEFGLYDNNLKDLCTGFQDSVTINIIIDACYAGEFLDDDTDFLPSSLPNFNAHIHVLASCGADETCPSGYWWDNGWSDDRFLPGLEKESDSLPAADFNKDGDLSMSESYFFCLALGYLYAGDDDQDGTIDEDDVEINPETGTYLYIDNDGDSLIDEDPATRYPIATGYASAINETIDASLILCQNYPNPFNPITNIRYIIPNNCHVRLEIFDTLGRRIVTLVDEYKRAGAKTVQWNGRDKMGFKVSSGVYFYRIKANQSAVTKKMVLIR